MNSPQGIPPCRCLCRAPHSPPSFHLHVRLGVRPWDCGCTRRDRGRRCPVFADPYLGSYLTGFAGSASSAIGGSFSPVNGEYRQVSSMKLLALSFRARGRNSTLFSCLMSMCSILSSGFEINKTEHASVVSN